MATLLPQLAVPDQGAIDVQSLFEPSPPRGGRGQGEGVMTPPANECSPHPLTPSPSRGGGVILEIGFGGGEHLVAQAVAHPDARFIGVEPFMNGVASCLRHIADLHPLGGRGQGEGGAPTSAGDRTDSPNTKVTDVGAVPLTLPSPPFPGEKVRDWPNIRLHMGDARNLIARLPDASLDLVYILFPDPWPKARHHKRRLIQPAFLDALARVMKPGAEVRFATDWANYAEWTLDLFLKHPAFAWTAERANDWRKPWPGHVTTRYEAKRLGDCAPVWLRFGRESR